MCSSLAVEWATKNIVRCHSPNSASDLPNTSFRSLLQRVNCISPGYMATALTRVILDRDPELRDAWSASISSDSCRDCADHIRRFPFPPSRATFRGFRSQPDAHGPPRRPGGPQGSCVRCFSSSGSIARRTRFKNPSGSPCPFPPRSIYLASEASAFTTGADLRVDGCVPFCRRARSGKTSADHHPFLRPLTVATPSVRSCKLRELGNRARLTVPLTCRSVSAPRQGAGHLPFALSRLCTSLSPHPLDAHLLFIPRPSASLCMHTPCAAEEMPELVPCRTSPVAVGDTEKRDARQRHTVVDKVGSEEYRMSRSKDEREGPQRRELS